LEPLALIGIGGKYAVASKGNFGAKSTLLWKLKDYIDRKFMAQFENFPAMSVEVPCGGCAAKVSPLALCGLLGRSVENGVSSEDASLFNLGSQNYIASIDRLTAIVSDPYVFGEIAVNHSLNDIYAVGGRAKYIQVVAELPRATAPLHGRDLERLMAGIRAQCKRENVSIIGGHSGLSDELGVTISVIGETNRASSKKVSGKLGDIILITKPLGTGLVFSGLMHQKSTAKMVETALRSMQESNQAWGSLFHSLEIRAVTDVSGFGFLGHLLEILDSKTTALLFESKIPRFEGVNALIKSGVQSTAYAQNTIFLPQLLNSAQSRNFEILCDPQTSGGLLAVVPESKYNQLKHRAEQLGMKPCFEIGKIMERGNFAVELRP
jgi:selenide,water dikinase